MKHADDIITRALYADDRLAAALTTRKETSLELGYTAGKTKDRTAPIRPATALGAYEKTLGPCDIRRGLLAEYERLQHGIENSRESRDVAGKRLEGIKRELTALKEVETLIESALSLSRCEDSVFHKVIETGLAGRVMGIEEEMGGPHNIVADEWSMMRDDAQVFIVGHDWEAAVSGADVTAEVRAPYDVTCFEMTVSGRRCCYVQPTPSLSDAGGLLFVRASTGWFFFGRADPGDKSSKVATFVQSQVRAVCIALDAEAAVAETIRAPHRLNAARAERGKLPLFDYRIVTLNRKPRAAPLALPTEGGHRKRLHFRRGHWRHFTTHKTWIKWMLVGDPDLGWIDKHYLA